MPKVGLCIIHKCVLCTRFCGSLHMVNNQLSTIRRKINYITVTLQLWSIIH